MSIFIKFTNTNSDPTVVDIFRSSEVFTKDTLPGAPIVSLSQGETSYRDNGVLFGVTYYYMTRTTVGGSVYYSPLLRRKNTRNTGPGGDEIIYGNERFGYMGDLYLGEIAPPRFLDQFTPFTNVMFGAKNTYHKMVVDGRVMFIPSTDATLYGVSLAAIAQASDYAARLVAMHDTGNDVDSKIIQDELATSWGITADKRLDRVTASYNGYDYQMRLPRLHHPDAAFTNMVVNQFTQLLDGNNSGELLRLFGNATLTHFSNSAITNMQSRFNEREGTSLPPPVNVNQLGILTVAKTRLTAGRFTQFTMVSTNAGLCNMINVPTPTSGFRFAPILELIEGN